MYKMNDSRLYKSRRSCHPIFIVLILAGIFFLYFFLIYQAIIRQNIITVGVFQEQNAGTPEASAAFLNQLFSSESSDRLYEQGLLTLDVSGYGGSFVRLFLEPYTNLSLLLLGISLILIAGILFFWKMYQRQFIRDTRTLLAWIESDSERFPLAKSFPEPLILSIRRTKDRIKKQQMLHEEDNARILHYMEDISHQLKTPLSVIRIICEKMLLRFPEHEKSMEKCLAQVDRMNEMMGWGTGRRMGIYADGTYEGLDVTALDKTETYLAEKSRQAAQGAAQLGADAKDMAAQAATRSQTALTPDSSTSSLVPVCGAGGSGFVAWPTMCLARVTTCFSRLSSVFLRGAITWNCT